MNKLRAAAQAVMSAESLAEMAAALDALRDALAEPVEPESEYELMGRFVGTLNGRFVFAPEDNKIWPIGTALYAKIKKGEE